MSKVKEFRIPAGEQKLVYQFKGFTASQMDELDAMLSRAGIVTTPDFNKRTITTYSNRDAMKLKKNKSIQRFIKSKGGKQIKEGTCGYGLDGKSIDESKAEKEKIFNMLVKRGDTPVDARYEVNKSYDFVKKRFSKASVSKKAEIISRLSKFESVNEANNIDKIKDIVKKKQFKRIGGVIIDMQTANAIMKVHKALTGSNKKKYEKLSISKMADIAYKLIK